MEERVSTRKVSSEGESLRAKTGGNVALRPVFKIESSARHWICAVGNYKRATAAKRVAHTSLVEIATHF